MKRSDHVKTLRELRNGFLRTPVQQDALHAAIEALSKPDAYEAPQPPDKHISVQKFWLVWPHHVACINENFRQPTKDAAVAEAMRLAAKNDDSYYVLEVVGGASPLSAPANYEDAT